MAATLAGLTKASWAQEYSFEARIPAKQWYFEYPGALAADGSGRVYVVKVSGDPDHGGATNLMEYQLGSDPQVPGDAAVSTAEPWAVSVASLVLADLGVALLRRFARPHRIINPSS